MRLQGCVRHHANVFWQASVLLHAGLTLLAGLMLATPVRADDTERRCLGPIASTTLPIRPAAFRPGPDATPLAALRLPVTGTSDQVRLTYVGHSTFTIESAQGITVETDYNDYVRSVRTPMVATMNKAHSTHFSRFPDPAIAHVLRGWNPAGGPARHGVTQGDLHIRNIPTNIRDYSGSTDVAGNSIFVIETADLCIAHLGHLHHTLDDSHRKAMGRIDVLLAPVDGSYTLDLDGMVEVIESLRPAIVIPMHFFNRGTLDRFVERLSAGFAVDRRAEPSLTLSRATLPERPTLILLPGR